MSLNWQRDGETAGAGAAGGGTRGERQRAELEQGYEARLERVPVTEPNETDRVLFRWAIVDGDGVEQASDTSDTAWDAERQIVQAAQDLFGGYSGPSGSGPAQAG